VDVAWPPVIGGESELPISESIWSRVKVPEIGPGGRHVPSGIFTGPREISGQELEESEGAGMGLSSERVKSRFLIALSLEESLGDVIVIFHRRNDRNPRFG
jgi:hypothetical protein